MNIDQTAQSVKVPDPEASAPVDTVDGKKAEAKRLLIEARAADKAAREQAKFEAARLRQEERAAAKLLREEEKKTAKVAKDKAKAEERAAREDEKARKPSIDMRYSAALLDSPDYAIAGRSATGEVDPTLYRWENTHWQALKEAEEERAFLNWVGEVEARRFSAKTAREATLTATRMLMGHQGHDLSLMTAGETQPIIPTPDGYLRIEQDGTIRVLPADRRRGITYCVPARLAYDRVRNGVYVPAPVPPQSKFGQYLDRFFPQPIIPENGTEVRDMLQEACAATLLPICFERALVLVGDGANGKSTLLHLLRRLHPQHAAFRLEQAKSRFGFQSVPGKTLLIASEAPEFLGNETEQALKSLISHDCIQVELKNRDAITVTPRCTLVIAANSPLRFSDRTYGSARKYLHIPFDVRMSDKSPDRVTDFHKQITENPREMSVLLDWLLEGAQRLIARGRLPEQPEAVTELNHSMRMDTDTVYAWARDVEIEVNDNTKSSKRDIYEHYVRTATEDGGRPVGAPDFWRRLRQITGTFQEAQVTQGGRRIRTVNLRIPPANVDPERLRLPRGFLGAN